MFAFEFEYDRPKGYSATVGGEGGLPQDGIQFYSAMGGQGLGWGVKQTSVLGVK